MLLDYILYAVYVIGGIVVAYFLFMLIVCMWEKQSIRDFEPIGKPALETLTPYLRAMNEQAQDEGFMLTGWCEKRSRRLYNVIGTFWVSPDLHTLALVGGGKIGGMTFKKTLLFTKLANEKVLLSVDGPGEPDLSGTIHRRYLMNADFGELYIFHLERIEKAGVSWLAMNPDGPLGEMEQIERMRADALVQAGRAKYVDPDRMHWRYNFRGALAFIRRAFLGREFGQGLRQINRIDKPQPGD